MTPEQAFERVKPHLAAAGVTRVAEITGLDRIGIPVFISTRPAARTLAVDSGKGSTPAAARASAAFESIERHVAETAHVPHLELEWTDIAEEKAATDLPRVRGSVPAHHVKYRFAWARDVNAGGAPVAVPLAAVKLLAGAEMPLNQWVWASTSNGLSASTDYDGAVFQGLCEVIERDACACHQWAALELARTSADASNAWLAEKCFEPGIYGTDGTNRTNEIPELLEKIHAAGCEVRCFDFTMPDTELPVVQCFIYSPTHPEEGLYKGYGAHPDPAVATRRAITEAVQSRCVIVAGARDDIDSVKFAQTRGENVACIVQALHAMEPGECEMPPECQMGWPEIAEVLSNAGFARVLVYDFGEHHGAHVVRVIVPGLAGYWTPEAPTCERMRGFAAAVKEDGEDK